MAWRQKDSKPSLKPEMTVYTDVCAKEGFKSIFTEEFFINSAVV